MPGRQSEQSRDVVKGQVRQRDGYRCTSCGMTNQEHQRLWDKQLEVHRLKPGSRYTVDGCVTICKRCHGPQPKRKRYTVDHAYGNRVPVGSEQYAILVKLAAEGNRPPHWQLRIILDEYFKAHGLTPPPVGPV